MTDIQYVAQPRAQVRNSYSPPEFRRYGHLEDLIQQFSSSPLSDAGSNQMAPVTPPS